MMKNQKLKKFLKEVHNLYFNPYRLSYGIGPILKESETAKENFKKVEIDSNRVCFGGYVSLNSFNEGKRGLFHYPPLHLKLTPTLIGGNIPNSFKKIVDIIPDIQKQHEQYIEYLIATLNFHVDIIYDKSTELISIMPKVKYHYIEMLAILTKFRTIFEPPYLWAELCANIFREEFPELNREEIAYLFNVFIFRSPSGHGMFSSGSDYVGSLSLYMPFDEIMKRAATGKYNRINSGDSILTSKTFKNVSENRGNFPIQSIQNNVYVSRYEKLLEKKDEIINQYIKIYENKNSLSTNTKREHFSVA